MNNRKIKNANDEFIDIEVVRYFVNNGNEYLIYSLNEIDESGYTKLYASKIIGTKACIISDNDEWMLIKDIIKQIVRSNRDGSEVNIIDLNEDNLDDVILQDTRVFKLQGNLVTLLSENKKILEEKEDIDIEETIDIDYEELYNGELNKNKELEEQINNLQELLTKYENKINSIKEIVE